MSWRRPLVRVEGQDVQLPETDSLLHAVLAGRVVSGLTATITPADIGKLIICTSSSPVTLTLATEAAGSWAVSDRLPSVHVIQRGEGAVTITGDGFTVDTHASENNVTDGQNSVVTVTRLGIDEFVAYGRLVKV